MSDGLEMEKVVYERPNAKGQSAIEGSLRYLYLPPTRRAAPRGTHTGAFVMRKQTLQQNVKAAPRSAAQQQTPFLVQLRTHYADGAAKVDDTLFNKIAKKNPT